MMLTVRAHEAVMTWAESLTGPDVPARLLVRALAGVEAWVDEDPRRAQVALAALLCGLGDTLGPLSGVHVRVGRISAGYPPAQGAWVCERNGVPLTAGDGCEATNSIHEPDDDAWRLWGLPEERPFSLGLFVSPKADVLYVIARNMNALGVYRSLGVMQPSTGDIDAAMRELLRAFYLDGYRDDIRQRIEGVFTAVMQPRWSVRDVCRAARMNPEDDSLLRVGGPADPEPPLAP